MNRKVFFDEVRESLFRGRMAQHQVDGINTILDEWNDAGFNNRQWLAYILATAFHETAFTMKPLAEYGRGRGKKYGEKDPQTGHAYYGRGFVQLTWRENYERASRHLGVDFVRNPDGVMQPDFAAYILIHGMAEGWFTGKELADYINERQRDYWNARRIVNGTDRAGAIADYALRFDAAINAAHDAAPNQPGETLDETEAHWLVRLIKGLFQWMTR